jgi:catechol 2,3-dioxygenase-like lactoylglutathione lyase family enzyme
MGQAITKVMYVVRDYDEALDFFRNVLRFEVLEDVVMGGGKRWVVVGPRGGHGVALVLGRAVTADQESRIGDQTGGRVFLFLEVDDFWDEYHHLERHGVHFVEAPRSEPYGMVVVFLDLYGNRWDLIGSGPSKDS